MDDPFDSTRRRFLKLTAAAGAGLFASGGGRGRVGEAGKKEEAPDEEVSPVEDLLREHGVLKRVILIYREVLRRMGSNQGFPPEALAESAGTIRRFIEDYHEKLEEDHLFPRFRKANKLVDLVDVLTRQHEAGRKLTDRVLRLANAPALKDPDDRRTVADSLRLFIRMYEPHEAREDTVLFPALRSVVSPQEYGALGENFEKKEHQLFGQDGFEKMVDRVAGIEKTLGIYDLAQFTPRI